jgi:uncharacterized membrane protein
MKNSSGRKNMKEKKTDNESFVLSNESGSNQSSQNLVSSNKNASQSKTLILTQLSMLSAIIILMAFTPLGYFKYAPLGLSITLLTIPVVIGAIMMGPLEGGILGAVFGTTSFIQCFGLDAFGAALLAINPVLTFILCLVPRILIGIISGYAYKGFVKIRIKKAVSYGLSGIIGALTNTVFFIGLLIIFFGNTEFIQSIGGIITLVKVVVSINVLVEVVVCTIIVTILAKTIGIFLKRKQV